MPTPNNPKLPLCSELAAQPGRYMFASWLNSMITDQPQEGRQNDGLRLKGMLSAYLELDLIDTDQFRSMCAELNAFVVGAQA